MRIIIIDDEPEIAAPIKQVLEEQKYMVDMALDGEVGLTQLFDTQYDLAILDVMLPNRSGFSILKEIRLAGIATPVLMLTSRGSVQDRIQGLDSGADDYLPKPFSMDELMARVRSLLRRMGDNRSYVVHVKNIEINTRTRVVQHQGAPVELTPKEFSVLEFLLYNKNRTVSRFSLAEHVWGDDFDPFTMSNFIDVHIKNLRRKLKDDNRQVIKTIRGVGFIIGD